MNVDSEVLESYDLSESQQALVISDDFYSRGALTPARLYSVTYLACAVVANEQEPEWNYDYKVKRSGQD